MKTPRRFLPPIASLSALEALDRLGSASAAATELAVTQSAVSRQLQSLQEQLGQTLYTREGRRLQLTPQAREYAKEVRAALSQIARASLSLTAGQAGGALTLAILPGFGMRWLVPRLSEFARLHPEITINMSTRLAPFNFDGEPFDAAIFFGNGDFPGTDVLRLRPETVIPVCAPQLLEGHLSKSPEVLQKLPLLHIETRPEAWRQWFRSQGVAAPRTSGMVYDQFSTITQAALHGLGVALLPDFLAEQDLATGRLVRASDAPGSSLGAYYLAWPKSNTINPSLRLFRDWLATQAQDEDTLPR